MTVVFLHGFLGAPSTWDAVRARLVEPSLAPVLPWHGLPPAECGAASFEDVADAIASRVEPGSVLCGYSMGARLALSIAIRRPHLVRAAILIGVCAGLDASAAEARRREDEARAQRLESFGLDAFVQEWEAQPLFASQRELPAGVRVEERARRLGHDARSVARALRVLSTGAQPDYRARLRSLAVPLTLLAGARDEKFVALHEEIAARSPPARALVADACGHNLALEAPALVARALEHSLESRRQAS